MLRTWVLALGLLAGCEPSESGLVKVRVHEDGSYSPKGPFVKHARLLIDAPLEAAFECVKPLLIQAIETDGVTDLAFRLDGRILDFPVQTGGLDLRVYEGGRQTVLWTRGSDPEGLGQIDVRAGPRGTFLVEGIRPGGAARVEVPLESPVPRPTRVPSAVEEWSADRLRREFRKQPVPYVAFKVSGRERTADVLLCLDRLKSVAGRQILPEVSR